MQDAADAPSASAVDLAEWLVERGMPFREAHAVVGGLVRDSVERHVPLAELVVAHPALGEEALFLLEPGVAVTRRTTPGGAGPGAVAAQMERFRNRLDLDDAPSPAWLIRVQPRIPIRYGEVDMQGVVFNAHYLAYCDDACGLVVPETLGRFEDLGWEPMVVKALVEWQGRRASATCSRSRWRHAMGPHVLRRGVHRQRR